MSERVTKTLLLVDDNPDLRSAATEFLVDEGYRVRAAASAEAALAIWNENRDTIDLVITDFMLPGMDGIGLLSRIAAAGGRTPALVISSYLDDERMRRQIAAGELHFLAKPFAIRQLAEKVAEALEGRPYREPAGVVGSPEASASPWRRSWLWRAAVIAFSAMAIGFVLQAVPQSPPRLPDRPPVEVRRGIFVETLSPRGELRTVPLELDWEALPDAVGYQVHLETYDEVVLWRTASLKPPVALPRALRATLRPHVVYCWKVTALGASGQRIAVSRRTPFMVNSDAPSEGADNQATERS